MTTVPDHPHVLLELQQVIATALAEDLGADPSPERDVTAVATVPRGATACAAFVARQAGVLAGLGAITQTWAQLDPDVTVSLDARDGDDAVPGTAFATVQGRAWSVLAGERTALNILTHLSGIATTTRHLVDAVRPHNCLVRDTRKTLPGLRLIQKQAVIAGGGANHRMSLRDELLVKDNHVGAAGGMAQAAAGAMIAPDGLPVQVEVDSLAQLQIVLDAGITRVLLDNFSLEDTREGVRRCRALAHDTGTPIFVEASGGITLDTVAAIAATGVDSVAVGALTHSSGALDIGLDIHIRNDSTPGGDG